MKTKKRDSHELLNLMNVGEATYKDLQLLKIDSSQELSHADPDELYIQIQKITGRYHDPCVWDVFAAAIHEAKTGEKQRWWKWTPIRKQRQTIGTFCNLPKNK